MKKFFVIAGVAVTLLTSACAPGITQQYPNEVVLQQTIPVEQWQTYETTNLSLALPPSWRALDERVLEAELEGLNDYVEASLNFTFLATDFTASADFATNMNILEEDLPFEVSLEKYVQLSARSIKYFNEVKGDVTHRVIDLSGEQVGYLNYINKVPVSYSSETVAVTQYLFKRGSHC
jgi:hypothetical protein